MNCFFASYLYRWNCHDFSGPIKSCVAHGTFSNGEFYKRQTRIETIYKRRQYTLGLDDAFCHNNSRNGVDRKGRRSYTAMLLFGMISTQGYEHLFSSGPRILVFVAFRATEERLINRVESSEWTIIHECLIATIAHQFRMATKLMLALENIIGRFVIARGIKQFKIYSAMENWLCSR